jgi:hypothetical protein
MSNHDFNSNHDAPLELSSHGRARQFEILDALLHAAAARQARRRLFRRGGTLFVALTVGAVAVRLFTPAPQPAQIVHTPTRPPTEPTPKPPSRLIAESATPSPIPRPPSAATITIVTNEVVQLAECSAPPPVGGQSGRPTVCLLSDEQLLSALAETGDQYGLIRTDSRVTLVRNSP